MEVDGHRVGIVDEHDEMGIAHAGGVPFVAGVTEFDAHPEGRRGVDRDRCRLERCRPHVDTGVVALARLGVLDPAQPAGGGDCAETTDNPITIATCAPIRSRSRWMAWC